jgi:hypothetical protein
LWLSILAYNLGNLWRRLALPGGIEDWSLTRGLTYAKIYRRMMPE